MSTVPPVARSQVRPVTPGMRRVLRLATALVVLAGLPLFLAPGQTADWFSWTVSPPVTAVVLGAAYWASGAVEWTSARARAWANGRVAVPGVAVFTLATFVVTLVHLDRFHLAADLALHTRAITWAWIAIYGLVPLLLAVVWWRQQRVDGGDPARDRPLPPWLTTLCVALAALLAGLGLTMLVAPSAVIPWWPWELTPLTARALGAWVLGLGVSAAGVAAERDAGRARPVAVGAVALPVLAAIGLARASGDVDWGSLGAAGVIVTLVVWAMLGVVLLRLAHRAPSAPKADR